MTKCQRLVHMLTVKKRFCDKLNRYVFFNNVEKKNGKRPSWRESWNKKRRKYKDDNVVRRIGGEQKVLWNKMNGTERLTTFMTEHH